LKFPTHSSRISNSAERGPSTPITHHLVTIITPLGPKGRLPEQEHPSSITQHPSPITQHLVAIITHHPSPITQNGEVSGEVSGEVFAKHLTIRNPLQQRLFTHFGEVSELKGTKKNSE